MVEKLGEGGQCAVYHVRHRDDPRLERAIKVMFDNTPNALERFVGEAELLQRIDHPNVLKVHSISADSRPPWIVMDLLGGNDVDAEMLHAPFEPERAAQIIADVASGLAEVHSIGVRHRDIKPSNIMVGMDGVPRLIDFGIAREVARAHLTQAGMVIGTIAYLPPEVFEADDTTGIQDSAAADVYALGQTLYEMLVGSPAHPREGSSTRLLAMVMRDKLDKDCLDPRERRPQVPEELAVIVRDATRQRPEERIQTAAELERRLRAWLLLRHDAYTAPVQRVDVNNLPPPPTHRLVPPTQDLPIGRHARQLAAEAGELPAAPAPAAPPPVPTYAAPPPPPPQPQIDEAEPESGGFGRILMWMASSVGTVSVLAIIVTGTVVLLVGLWAYRPSALTTDPVSAKTSIQPMVAQQTYLGTPCADALPAATRAKAPTVSVQFDLKSGWVTNAVLASSTTGDPTADACVLAAVQKMTFGGAPDAAVTAAFTLQ